MRMRRAGAEAFGTFVLVFGGVGTAVIAGEAVGALGVAFAFGLSLLAMAYAIGPVSFSPKHSNFIVNSGGGTAAQVRDLIEHGRRVVLERFGIELDREIEYIGADLETA